MELSRTAYVILGMLKLGRRTGYEIKSFVDVSARRFWAASYGQIYPELKRLEGAGLIRGEDDPEGGRQRRAYELTVHGDRALHDWLASGEPFVHELRDESMLKFFFADALGPDERLALLRRQREMHEGVLAELRAMEPGAREGAEERGKEFPLLTLEWGMAFHEFHIDWCTRMEERLAAEETAMTGS
jgi:PadR family transcriptional regulator AphA